MRSTFTTVISMSSPPPWKSHGLRTLGETAATARPDLGSCSPQQPDVVLPAISGATGVWLRARHVRSPGMNMDALEKTAARVLGAR